jgi:lysyl-tRNA synthetase class 2
MKKTSAVSVIDKSEQTKYNQSTMNSNIIETMKLRSRYLKGIRQFFDNLGYTEADVPQLTRGVIPEAPIELFKTELITPFNKPEELFLLPSPEYYLKQLIAAGSGDIYSISRSFRNSEQQGRWHNPEFSMLEWYTMSADYLDSIKMTEDFFTHMLNTCGIARPELEPPFKRMSMTEVFEAYASFDLSEHCSGRLSKEEELNQLRVLATSLELSVSQDDNWEELFNLIFVHQIEPNLPIDRPVVIFDYPAGIPALAKPAERPGRLERWELYARGIELANCYTEETDYETISGFFRNEAAEKEDALIPVKADLAWCEIYKKSFPSCSGTALGIDRLMMLLSGTDSIEGVILFPFSDRISPIN